MFLTYENDAWVLSSWNFSCGNSMLTFPNKEVKLGQSCLGRTDTFRGIVSSVYGETVGLGHSRPISTTRSLGRLTNSMTDIKSLKSSLNAKILGTNASDSHGYAVCYGSFVQEKYGSFEKLIVSRWKFFLIIKYE